MGQLFAIGEVLIDFIPLQKGSALKDVLAFERAAGGAPANVAAAVSKLGGKAAMLTKLGKDAFGDYLIEQLDMAGVHTGFIQRTTEANTGLAFVSLQEDGERDFSFYRNPSSDLLLAEAEIDPGIFQGDDILHFGSVDLVESPMKQAHLKAIDAVERRGGLISFDPNVRLPLWTSPEECRKTIQAFIPAAHILKISEDEIEFITGIPSPEKAIAALFQGHVKAILYTRGKNGADLYLSPEEKYECQGFNVEVQDTTGAGDAFMGGFLYKLLDKKAVQDNITELLRGNHLEILQFANATGALTTMKKGAIPALPNLADVQTFIQKESNEGMITDVRKS
ncbi:carbohydrate kinase family protein [Paenibacillus lentus]|uniref:Carbohydrate kinase n=1 Tax=Paenibacillus lentus TaxID=1338368 RepID=A0A3Q8SCE6_9BACL|nr:carbohydrate kinase [Paenibacillus lentus]AZK47475.1 carbohydrate kinase [Paenibacillus lentus]